ncbi:MAG: LCP family protein [Propionibacteriaceae bacterium]|nr:LCP family protein [Propionibacteriaceae bacterium]
MVAGAADVTFLMERVTRVDVPLTYSATAQNLGETWVFLVSDQPSRQGVDLPSVATAAPGDEAAFIVVAHLFDSGEVDLFMIPRELTVDSPDETVAKLIASGESAIQEAAEAGMSEAPQAQSLPAPPSDGGPIGKESGVDEKEYASLFANEVIDTGVVIESDEGDGEEPADEGEAPADPEAPPEGETGEAPSEEPPAEGEPQGEDEFPEGEETEDADAVDQEATPLDGETPLPERMTMGATLEFGPSGLAESMCETLGVPADNLIMMSMKTFSELVDIIGGVTIEADAPTRDRASGLDLVNPGAHLFGAEETLSLMRAYDLEQLDDGSWSTIPLAEEVTVRAEIAGQAVSQVASQLHGARDPLTVHRLAWATAGGTMIDSAISTFDVTTFFEALDQPIPVLPVSVTDTETTTIVEPGEETWEALSDAGYGGVCRF